MYVSGGAGIPSAAAVSAAPVRRVTSPWNGYWVVDVSRSQSPAVHLEAIGLPDMAQAAANSIQPSYFITVDPTGTSVAIKHMSEIGEKERRLIFGVEHAETGRDGAAIRMVMTMPSPNVMVNTITWGGRGTIVDTRTLTEDSRGAMIQQQVSFTHAGKGPGGAGGRVSTSTRILVKDAEEG